MTTPNSSHATWAALDPTRARALTDVRLQVHHAAQFVSALGISYLDPAADDSHTTLGWDSATGALTSRSASGVTLALDVARLVLSVHGGREAGATIALHDAGIQQATEDVRHSLDRAGLDAHRYTLGRHFELPHHPVADGRPFDAGDHEGLQELARWFGNAAMLMEEVSRSHDGSPPVCWPHHFDIATLITVAPGRTTGAGLSPGDGYYDEPYFYVNASPSPNSDALVQYPLDGSGSWHTHEWDGAVLPGSTLAPAASAQQEQVRRFLQSAIGHTMSMLRR